jgi:gas vesicle protein
MENKKKKSGGLLTGLVVGGAVGSVLSFLFATEKRRKDTRKISKKILNTGKSMAEQFLEKYKK